MVIIERYNKHADTVEQKSYETVAERVRKFRADCPIDRGWGLLTEISFPNESTVRCIAQVQDPSGKILATGTAEENREASSINKTSAVENCETSAIGRALFAAGFGGGEFCSADELMTALKAQENVRSVTSEAVKATGAGKVSRLPKPKPPESQPSEKAQKPSPQPDETPGTEAELGPALKGVTYRKEANVVIAEGKTFEVKGLLKSAGFAWNGEVKGWTKEIGS